LFAVYHGKTYELTTGVLLVKDRAEQELNKLKITIREKEKELEGIKPAYDEMRRKEDECTRELSLKEQKRKELYAKQVCLRQRSGTGTVGTVTF
jgi:hypothetical protein